MHIRRGFAWLIAAWLAGGVLLVSGCESQGPFEEAGEEVDEAADEVEDEF